MRSGLEASARLWGDLNVGLLPFVEALPTREEPGEEIRGTLIPEDWRPSG